MCLSQICWLVICLCPDCRVLVSQPKNSAHPVFALADNEALIDSYMGIPMLWTHFVSQRSTAVLSFESSTVSEDIHSFRLRVHNKHQHMLQQYLAHVRKQADIIEKKGKELLVSSVVLLALVQHHMLLLVQLQLMFVDRMLLTCCRLHFNSHT